MDYPENDPNFDAPFRARSNTWPVRPKDLAEEEAARTPSSNEGDKDTQLDIKQERPNLPDGYGGQKKAGGSRRNAWGNLSYADLITKAIQSSPEGRLTLSQIYDWMVQNVPYFRDKGDSNSSAGWKNSIRHNLSLHSRFMRIQNEGTGKSSWWVLNPDAKASKTPRRRATSMDTKTYEKKRGRVKKKVEALRAAMAGDNLSETSSLCGSQDLAPIDPFALSPQDFRQRTSSNASSMGRLSPIQSMLEHDGSSPGPWGSLNSSPYNDSYGTGLTDQSLSESLADMFVGDSNNGGGGNGGIEVQDPRVTSSNLSRQLSPNYPQQTAPNQQRSPQYMPPPPYSEPLRTSPQPPRAQYVPQSLSELLSSEASPPLGGMTTQDSFLQQVDQLMASPPQGSTLGQFNYNQRGGPGSSLLRQALTTNCPPAIGKQQLPNGQQYSQHADAQLLTGGTMHTMQQQQPSLARNQHMDTSMLPNDLDMNDFANDFGNTCDVDQILKHELTFDDNLDFNFDTAPGSNKATVPVSGATANNNNPYNNILQT